MATMIRPNNSLTCDECAKVIQVPWHGWTRGGLVFCHDCMVARGGDGYAPLTEIPGAGPARAAAVNEDGPVSAVAIHNAASRYLEENEVKY